MCARVFSEWRGRMTDLHIDKLPPDTRGLFEFFAAQPEMNGRFVLTVGTAITLHHGHRRSEDLDFYSLTPKLPRRALDTLLQRIETAFEKPLLAIREEAIEDFENEGGNALADYQQNYTVGKVKLTFFAEHDAAQIAFTKTHVGARYGEIAILSSPALFAMKSRLIMKRTTSRDLFDLWFYLSGGHHSMKELAGYAMTEARTDWEGVRLRLLPVRLPSTDPGFEGMISDGPRTFEALIGALRALADEYEQGPRLDEVSGGTP